MRAPRSAAALALAAALAAAPAAAEPGVTGAATLLAPLGARASSLGEAFVGVDGGLDSLAYNPAGLSGAKQKSITSSFVTGAADDRMSFTAYAHPIGRVVVSAGFLYYDGGDIHLNLSDGTNRVVKASQDMAAVGGASLDLGGGLSVGGLAKVFRLELAQSATATGYAADAGVLWMTPVTGLSFGASLQNLGPDVKFEQEGDPLPMAARAGVSYLLDLERWEQTPDETYRISKFRLTADAVKVREEEASGGAGLEMMMPFGPRSYGAVRLGYIFNREADSYTVGVGFKERRFRFDYTLGARRVLGNSHQFTLGFLF